MLLLEQDIKKQYQQSSAIIGECVDVQFENTCRSTPISLSSSDKTINGWNLINSWQYEV